MGDNWLYYLCLFFSIKMLIICVNLERGGVFWNFKCFKFILLNFWKYVLLVNLIFGNLIFFGIYLEKILRFDFG